MCVKLLKFVEGLFDWVSNVYVGDLMKQMCSIVSNGLQQPCSPACSKTKSAGAVRQRGVLRGAM